MAFCRASVVSAYMLTLVGKETKGLLSRAIRDGLTSSTVGADGRAQDGRLGSVWREAMRREAWEKGAETCSKRRVSECGYYMKKDITNMVEDDVK